MLAIHTLYPQLCFGGINDKLKYIIIKTVFEWANKKSTLKEGLNEKQKAVFSILDCLFKESKLCKSYLKYKALYASSKFPRGCVLGNGGIPSPRVWNKGARDIAPQRART